ncbi:hypothetical protein FB451DRAFT_1237356 [Mycena latifolia]|nr:hypothetical protein FB451DRAFT_1237356 [Mycena latifolia]
MTNMSATPSTDEILFILGQQMYRDSVPHSVGFLFYGIYFVFFCVYLWFAMHESTKPRATKILLAVMLLLFLSTTAQFVGDMLLSLEQIRGYLMWTDVPLAERRALWLKKFEPAYVLEKWPTLNLMISDLIVIWRASVVYSQRRWWQVVLWTVAFADVVIWACAFALLSRDAEERSRNPATDQGLVTTSFFISLGTNLLGTGLMAAKARFVHSSNGNAPMSFAKWKDEVSRILLLLVETGAIWAALQLVCCIMLQVDTVALTPFDLATAVIQKSEIYLAAILPTATLIIVRLHRSFDSTPDSGDSRTPPNNKSTLLSTIWFDESPARTKGSGARAAELIQVYTEASGGEGLQSDLNTHEKRPTPMGEEMV